MKFPGVNRKTPLGEARHIPLFEINEGEMSDNELTLEREIWMEKMEPEIHLFEQKAAVEVKEVAEIVKMYEGESEKSLDLLDLEREIRTEKVELERHLFEAQGAVEEKEEEEVQRIYHGT